MYAAYKEQLESQKVPYKFTYFGVRGRAQPIRYLLEDLQVKYEENTINDFPEFFKSIKATLKFGQLPVLQDGDMELPQSGAIIRHLARENGAYGDSAKEAAQIDMLREKFVDMREAILKLIFIGDEAEYQTKKKEFVEKLPAELEKLESILKENKGGDGFFVGSKPSIADYSMLDILMWYEKFVPGCQEKTPALSAFVKRMCDRPNLKKFMASDRFKNCPITIKDRLL